jgi:MarC family membrane protein
MDMSFSSVVVVLLLVMDPIGNIPLFVLLLREVSPGRRTRVIVRECAIAFGILLAFVFGGNFLLDLLALSDASLNIAGGVILFMISIRMVFRGREPLFGDEVKGEPFIVPLAVPAIAGPASVASVILLMSRAPQRQAEWIAALFIAIVVTLALLVFADRISNRIGERGVLALERLMGLILTAVAVQMLLRGIEAFVMGLR